MSLIPLVLVALIILLVIFLIIALRKKEPWAPDYYGMFIIGIVWMGASFLLKNYFFGGLGLVFTIIGIVNMNKWKKHSPWSNLSRQEKVLRLAIFILLLVFLIGGIIMWLYNR